MTDPTPLKACATCVYCKGNDIFLYCTNPDYSYETKDYIQGTIHTNYSLCVLTRDNEKLCGDVARGWEEKSSTEPEYHRGLWSAFKGLCKEFF